MWGTERRRAVINYTEFSLGSNSLLWAPFNSGEKVEKNSNLQVQKDVGNWTPELRCLLSWFPQQDPPLRFRCGYQPWEQVASGAGGRWVVATTRMRDWHLPVASRESELRFRHVYTRGRHSQFKGLSEHTRTHTHWLHIHQVTRSHTEISLFWNIWNTF